MDDLHPAIVVLIILLTACIVIMWAMMGADILITHECKALGYDQGGFDFWTWRTWCEYEALRVPFEDILKNARPPLEGTAL